jgi:hypothetical protein
VIKNQDDVDNEISINKTEKEVLKKLKAKETETFIDSIEEDTEELEISFEEYLAKINNERVESQVAQSTNVSIEELDNLFNSTDLAGAGQLKEGNININAEKGLGLGEILKEESSKVESSGAEELSVNVNPEFLNEKETTSSVEILKEHFKGDKEFVQLLNQLGEIDVRYPKLFETVWQSIE